MNRLSPELQKRTAASLAQVTRLQWDGEGDDDGYAHYQATTRLQWMSAAVDLKHALEAVLAEIQEYREQP